MIKFGIQNSAETLHAKTQEAPTFKDFFTDTLSTKRISAEKDGPTFTSSIFRGEQRNIESVLTTQLIVFDIDQKEDDDLIMLEEMEDALIDLNLEHGIYTSYSNTAETPRYRVILPTSRLVYPEEYLSVASATLESIDDMLDGRLLKVADRCWKETSRCYFLFTVHPDRQNGAVAFYNPGNPVDVDEMKMHQSEYGQDFHVYQPRGARNGVGAGTSGRSYDLNRVVSAMHGTASPEEITQRLLEYDAERHAGNEYFRDLTYSRNRPRGSESQDQASRRACESYVRSHLNWLSRKMKNQPKEAIVSKKAESRDPMPQHNAFIKIRSVKDQPTKKGGESALVECQVMSGEHAGRHFWHRFYGSGNSPMAIKISKSITERIAKATDKQIDSVKDLIKAEGNIIRVRIKHNPGSNGFPAQNEIGGIYLD